MIFRVCGFLVRIFKEPKYFIFALKSANMRRACRLFFNRSSALGVFFFGAVFSGFY